MPRKIVPPSGFILKYPGIELKLEVDDIKPVFLTLKLLGIEPTNKEVEIYRYRGGILQKWNYE